MKRILELDGLRFFAIFAVLAVHYRPASNHFYDFMSVGWAGVDLFFAISGFLITTVLLSLRGTSAPYRVFYSRRTLRIFPPYYLVLIALLVVLKIEREQVPLYLSAGSLLFLSSLKLSILKQTAINLSHHLAFDTSTKLLDTHIFTSFQAGLGIFWSLSIEELFYLVWAPIVLKGSRSTVRACVILPLFLCPVLRFLVHTRDYLECFGFFFRFDSLTAGALVALLFFAHRRGEITGKALQRVLLGVVGVAAPVLLELSWYEGLFRRIEIRSTLGFAVFGYTLLSLLCSGLVGLCVHWSGKQILPLRLLRTRALVYAGMISYTMYLVHIPMYVLLIKVQRHMGAGTVNAGLATAAVATAGTLLLAAVSWKYFERPILRLKDRRFRTPQRALAEEAKLLEQES